MWSTEAAIAALAVLATFAFSGAQSQIASRAGSDHPVHAFLRDGIRANNFRLFVTVPRLLNVAHCAALPLYLHWVLARLPAGAIRWSERLLNPLVNAAHVFLLAIIASTALRSSDDVGVHAGHVALLFGLTPQTFHALSARNFGLSARGTGLLLLTAFFACSHLAGTATPLAFAWWIAMAVLAWLVWGFSTFAQQALVLLSLLLLVAGHWRPAAGAALGLLLFIALHPAYALSYLRHTAKFLRAYARELAPIYVLERRASIWRDLVWDLWRKPQQVGATKALLYAYENSVIVVAILNPMTVLAAMHMVSGAARDGWLSFAGALTLVGLAATVLTTFRPTRFLGEPERYAEVVTPWASLYAAEALGRQFGSTGVWIVISIFALMNVVQLSASWMLMRHVTVTNDELEEVARVAEEALGPSVRFCCNNEQATKMLMGRPWQFAYFIAVGQDYAGMNATEAFARFPFLRQEACERVARHYRVNCLLLDLKVFDRVFEEPPPDLIGARTLYRSARFQLLRLDWQDSAQEAGAVSMPARGAHSVP